MPDSNNDDGLTFNYPTGNPEKTPFGLNVDDETLVSTINTWVAEAITWHDLMILQQNIAVKYYLGDQTDRDEIPTFNSDTVYNRIFEGTETIIPIVTGGAHAFIAIPGNENEVSIQKAQKLQKVLMRKYEDLEIQSKNENVTRDIILKRFGVMKWDWNVYTDDVDVRVIDPRLILIPKLRLDANSPLIPYVIEVQSYTRDEIKEEFPDVSPDDLVFGRYPEVPTVSNTDQRIMQNMAPTYQVLEVTTNEYKCWKQGGKILKKMKNPYFDWDGTEVTEKVTKQNGKVKKHTYRRYDNHLDYPQKNYVFFNPFTTGDAPVAETSMAEIVIPIQDDINTQKRQISNNLVKMGNGQVYLDSDTLPKELADQITNEPGLILEGKNLASENRIRREPGTPLPNAHFTNLQLSLIAFDNVFGVHGAVRGAGDSKTLGGQILNRQQDLSRIDALTRCINKGMARLADGLVQMMKMYYDTEHVFKILGANDAIEFIRFNKADIEDDVAVNVKSGVPPILDPVARYNQAIQLWQLGALDPETLFSRLEFPDPRLAAEKLAAWRTGQLLQKTEARIKEVQAGVAARGSAGGEKGGGDVETPANVIDRAQNELSGYGRAPLKNTPK